MLHLHATDSSHVSVPWCRGRSNQGQLGLSPVPHPLTLLCLQLCRSYVNSKLKEYPQFQVIAHAISKSGFKVRTDVSYPLEIR